MNKPETYVPTEAGARKSLDRYDHIIEFLLHNLDRTKARRFEVMNRAMAAGLKIPCDFCHEVIALPNFNRYRRDGGLLCFNCMSQRSVWTLPDAVTDS